MYQAGADIIFHAAGGSGEGVFEASLLIDDRCEIMADHTTGQHIQGMAVVEAARQMFLVVTEQFYIGGTSDRHYYFVIHQMDIAYQNFLFPVPATLRYEVLEAATDNPERLSFTARITIRQAGKDAASMAAALNTSDGLAAAAPSSDLSLRRRRRIGAPPNAGPSSFAGRRWPPSRLPDTIGNLIHAN